MSEVLNLSVLSSVYFWLGTLMTIFFILKLLFYTMFGMDEGAGDALGTGLDNDFGFISLQTIIAFLMGFGWTGYTSLQWKSTGEISLLFAFIGGLFFMSLSAYLLFLMRKLNSTPKYDLQTCVGKEGTSYTRFAPNGAGKIQISFNGRLETFDAWNETQDEIESFKQIKVTKVVDKKIYIIGI